MELPKFLSSPLRASPLLAVINAGTVFSPQPLPHPVQGNSLKANKMEQVLVLVGGARDPREVSRQGEGKEGWGSSSFVLLGPSDPP